MEKNIKIMLTQANKLVSVNNLYSARVIVKNGRYVPVLYKTVQAKKLVSEIINQLRAIDFTDHIDWLKNSEGFDLNIQFILRTNFSRRDCSNMIKAVEDAVVMFFRDDLGIENYDDSKHIRVISSKSFLKSSKHEYILIQLSPTKFNPNFSFIEKPDNVYINTDTLNKKLDSINIKHTDDLLQIDNTNANIFIIGEKEYSPETIATLINSIYTHLESGFCYSGFKKELDKDSVNKIMELINKISEGRSNIVTGWIDNDEDILKNLL